MLSVNWSQIYNVYLDNPKISPLLLYLAIKSDQNIA